jgi:ABC-2 type transport system ATP-binding protein
LILVENKDELMRKLGKKQMTLELRTPLAALPPSLAKFPLALGDDGCKLIYTYDTQSEQTGITDLLDALRSADVRFKDLATTQTSLEDIFVSLLRNGA